MRSFIAGIKVLTFEGNVNTGNNSNVTTNNCQLNRLRTNELVYLQQVINEKINKKEIFYSFELFPMKEPSDIYKRFFAEMDKHSPAFYALTWHTKNVINSYLSLDIVEQFPSPTLLHVAGKGLKRCNVEMILKRAYDLGIRNIFALQGDSVLEDGDFPYAIDLVKFIRSYFGQEFSICVAGYPDMHPSSPNKDFDLFHLKAKVDAGADFIITQIFFESDTFINFVNDCRNIGITIPIIPGIFPIPEYKSLQRMTDVCRLNIPNKIFDRLEAIKNDDEAVKNFGIEFAINLIKDIIERRASYGFHLFTLNKITMIQNICNRLNLIY
ncbi:methylenetetrahydrofolate reductase isoform X2 [Vespa velutina]|uniref:methylenetetrahydrofolate reductase isoform X2 n=1 Tax=Vespa velutina TaxID=202808 RepID=UPI001FB36C94|nr:methylenetetrahydrofolate reductase isoform X2 [Vespa velutina]